MNPNQLTNIAISLYLDKGNHTSLSMIDGYVILSYKRATDIAIKQVTTSISQDNVMSTSCAIYTISYEEIDELLDLV